MAVGQLRVAAVWTPVGNRVAGSDRSFTLPTASKRLGSGGLVELELWLTAFCIGLVCPVLAVVPASAETDSVATITGIAIEQDSGQRIPAWVGLYRAGEGVPTMTSDTTQATPFTFRVPPGTYYLCTLGSTYIAKSCSGAVRRSYSAETFQVGSGETHEATLVEVSGNQPYRQVVAPTLTGSPRFGGTLKLNLGETFPADSWKDNITWYYGDRELWHSTGWTSWTIDAATMPTKRRHSPRERMSGDFGKRVRVKIVHEGPSGTPITTWATSAPVVRAPAVKVFNKGRITRFASKRLEWGADAAVTGMRSNAKDFLSIDVRWWVGKKAMPRRYYALPLRRAMIGKRLKAKVTVGSPWAHSTTYVLRSRTPVLKQSRGKSARPW